MAHECKFKDGGTFVTAGGRVYRVWVCSCGASYNLPE
jgi:CDGSH-type Zn-finger protein